MLAAMDARGPGFSCGFRMLINVPPVWAYKTPSPLARVPPPKMIARVTKSAEDNVRPSRTRWEYLHKVGATPCRAWPPKCLGEGGFVVADKKIADTVTGRTL